MLKFNICFAGVLLSAISTLSLAENVVIRDGGVSVVEVPNAVVQVQDAIAKITKSNAQGVDVKTFRYRENEVYKVFIKPSLFTAFSIPKDEVIKDFAFDQPGAVEVKVNPDTNVGLVKLVTSTTVEATLVTDKHIYYISISPATDTWYQGVNWKFDDPSANDGFGYHSQGAVKAAAAAGDDSFSTPNLDNGLNGHPNFSYTMAGDAAIKPVSVWDNGKWTWIQFDNSTQSIPAVFFIGTNGPEVVNYTMQPGGKQLLVNRLMSKFMLRLGDLKVLVTAK